MILEAIANGLGSQSMYVLLLAARGEIPATVSITADTGWENDCLWNTGERTSALEYWDRVVVPICDKYHLAPPCFTRSVDKYKHELPSLLEFIKERIASGKLRGAHIPLFGSKGGQMRQMCTDKWKIRAIRQQARKIGATQLVCAQGIHAGEVPRRIKGKFIGEEDGRRLYQDTITRKIDGEKVEVPVKWCQHYYPLVDRMKGRNDAIAELEMEGIPYLVTSQCDGCPLQDLARWERHTPQVLLQIAAIEDSMNGDFFFTDERVPLLDALEIKRNKPRPTLDANFGCGNSYCGI